MRAPPSASSSALERGPLSLIGELRERPLPDSSSNLLILVEQFEELFRYRGLAGSRPMTELAAKPENS